MSTNLKKHSTPSNDIALLCEEVTVQFASVTALDHVTFKIKQGDFLAVVGPNGGGKSSLIHAILGLIQPNSGKIELRAGSVGYVPQLKTPDRSFPAVALELVATGVTGRWPWHISKELKEKCIESLTYAGAEHLAKRNIAELSGGELQRVYLARSLARKPDTIFLDEPATGIDVKGEEDMYRTLESVQKQKRTTIIMVTHDIEAAQHHASHVLLLNKKVIGFGEPKLTLDDQRLRIAYGHVGHSHPMHGSGCRRHNADFKKH